MFDLYPHMIGGRLYRLLSYGESKVAVKRLAGLVTVVDDSSHRANSKFHHIHHPIPSSKPRFE